MSLIVLFLHISKGLLFFRKFFCYFVKFEPKLLLLFIAADVMMLLVFVQRLCIVAPSSFAIQIRMAASTCVFPGASLTTFAQPPKPRAITAQET